MARACIVTKGLPGKCHRNNGIGAKKPTNWSGGKEDRPVYKDPGQKPPTDANPVDQRKQIDAPGMKAFKGSIPK